MALTEIEVAKIQVDYTAGKLSKSKIAQKHSISRNTLAKYAHDGKWKYGQNAQELSSIIQEKTYERLIRDEVDRATKITDEYLGDISKYRQIAMVPASELANAYNEARKLKGKVKKEEFSRIWESAKAIKTAIEALNLGYNGARKALGLDVEADIEKARKIKGDSSTDDDRKTRFDSMSEDELKEEKERLLSELKELDE